MAGIALEFQYQRMKIKITGTRNPQANFPLQTEAWKNMYTSGFDAGMLRAVYEARSYNSLVAERYVHSAGENVCVFSSEGIIAQMKEFVEYSKHLSSKALPELTNDHGNMAARYIILRELAVKKGLDIDMFPKHLRFVFTR